LTKPKIGWWIKYEKDCENWPKSVECVIESGDIWGQYHPSRHNNHIPTGHFTRKELCDKIKELVKEGNVDEMYDERMEAVGIISSILYELYDRCVYIEYQ